MEFARRRKRRQRRGSGAGKIMAGLAAVGLAVYLITASAAGKWLAEEVMAPAFSALSELPIFSSDAMEQLEEETAPEQDVLSVSLNSGGNSVSAEVALPALEVYALQMGAFSSAENAGAMAGSIQARGAGGYICQDGEMYRVLAAGYGSQSDAKAVKDRLVEEGADCTLYTISAPAVTFSITASEEQLQEIKGGFSALVEAQSALMAACLDFDSKGMAVQEGQQLIRNIGESLSAACQPLDKYSAASPAISAITGCRDKFTSSLTALGSGSFASPSELSAQMKYALLELSDAYSAMLSSISA